MRMCQIFGLFGWSGYNILVYFSLLGCKRSFQPLCNLTRNTNCKLQIHLLASTLSPKYSQCSRCFTEYCKFISQKCPNYTALLVFGVPDMCMHSAHQLNRKFSLEQYRNIARQDSRPSIQHGQFTCRSQPISWP